MIEFDQHGKVGSVMIHFVAIFDALLRFYVASTKCKKIQHFKGKKKGDSVNRRTSEIFPVK